MKAHAIVFFVVLVGLSVPAVGAAGPSSPPLARPSGGQAISSTPGATVFHGTACQIPIPGQPIIVTTGHTVITPSGNAALSCHADSETHLAAQAQVLMDMPCFIKEAGFGTDSLLVATPSGHAVLWCHVHPRAHQKVSNNGKSGLEGQGAGHRWRHAADTGTGQLTRQ
jgi:hypothetical protein